MKRLTGILTLILLLHGGVLSAQQLQAKPEDSKIIIKGTSSLHDWESEAQEFSISVNQSDNTFSNLQGSILVKSIKSGKSIMNDKTYDALNADDYPQIKLASDELTLANGKLTGKIQVTIKGTTQTFDLSATSTLSNGNVQVKGAVPLDMTEFGIEPPTAMFGTLETGKDVTIDYQITLIQ